MIQLIFSDTATTIILYFLLYFLFHTNIQYNIQYIIGGDLTTNSSQSTLAESCGTNFNMICGRQGYHIIAIEKWIETLSRPVKGFQVRIPSPSSRAQHSGIRASDRITDIIIYISDPVIATRLFILLLDQREWPHNSALASYRLVPINSSDLLPVGTRRLGPHNLLINCFVNGFSYSDIRCIILNLISSLRYIITPPPSSRNK